MCKRAELIPKGPPFDIICLNASFQNFSKYVLTEVWIFEMLSSKCRYLQNAAVAELGLSEIAIKTPTFCRWKTPRSWKICDWYRVEEVGQNSTRERRTSDRFVLYNKLIKVITPRKHRQSYRHADPRRQRPQVAQQRIGMRNTGHGH